MNEKFYGWHLLSIKPNCYKIAEGNLNRQGCNVFIPKHMITIRKGNRFLDQLQPLFPGYVFAEISKHSCDVRVLNNNNANKSNIPEQKTIIPKISASLFKVKLINKLAAFLISIFMNQIYHFVSSNFCC